MRAVVQHDMNDAAYDFQRVVWPVIADNIGGGQFYSTEQYRSDPIAQLLDMYAGIDGIQLSANQIAIRGLAIRLQWCHKPYNTFTVRHTRTSGTRTEYEKRIAGLNAVRHGAIYPYFTIQAYVTKRRVGHLLSVAVTTTKTLYSYIADNNIQTRTNNDDGNEFFYVPWTEYMKHTISCSVFDENGETHA